MTRPLMGYPGLRWNWIWKKTVRVSAKSSERNQTADAPALVRRRANVANERRHCRTGNDITREGMGAHARALFVAPRSGDPHKHAPHSANCPPNFYHTCKGEKSTARQNHISRTAFRLDNVSQTVSYRIKYG